MMNMLKIEASVRQLVSQQLAVARATAQPVADAARDITEKLVDLCFREELGFLPDEPIELAQNLLGATVTGICCDYKTEITITV
jgi:hypothetical protein